MWREPESSFLNHYFLQAIEAAIEMKLKTVEAGAQGEHKIQRGYLPTATYSAHYLPDPDFHDAIESFLLRETVQVSILYIWILHAWHVTNFLSMSWIDEYWKDMFRCFA